MDKIKQELEAVQHKINYITEKIQQCQCKSMFMDLDFLQQKKLDLQTKLYQQKRNET